MGISNSALDTCLSGARPDLSPEDNVIAQALAECSPRPYKELIKSDIPGPSSSRSTRPAVLRPSPPSTMKVSPLGLSAAKPTKGELLARVEMLSRKSRSVKRKTLDSVDKRPFDLGQGSEIMGVFFFPFYPCSNTGADVVASD